MKAMIAAALVFAASTVHAQLPTVTGPTAGNVVPVPIELWQLQSNLVALSAHVYQLCLQQKTLSPQLGGQCIPPAVRSPIFQLDLQAGPEGIPQ
jgi:hypothetical protein